MIDYTKRRTPALEHPHRISRLEFRLAWPEIRQPSILRELRHTMFSAYGGAHRAELEIYSMISGPDGAGPEPVSRRNTPSNDGCVQHTVTSPPPDDTLANAVRSGMPAGSETVAIDVVALPPGTTVVFAAVAWQSFDLAQLGPIGCRLADPVSGQIIEDFVVPHVDRIHNCRILARLSQTAAGQWGMTRIGTTTVGRTLKEFVSATRRHV